jgi:putative transposase
MYPIATLCRLLGVSTSGYYDARQRPPSARTQRQARIRHGIQAVYDQHHGIYGSWKIAEVLAQRDDLESACRNTVAKAMRELGLKSKVGRAFQPTTTRVDPAQRPAENLLGQDFAASAPNRKWAADITYLPTGQGWVYLAVVLDLFSRRIVGWSIGVSLATELVSQALRAAIEARRPEGRQLLHHSDRGCQYTSAAYQQTLATLGITCSMSRTGCCYDNAAMERFFWSLKHEWTGHETFADLQEARMTHLRQYDSASPVLTGTCKMHNRPWHYTSPSPAS